MIKNENEMIYENYLNQAGNAMNQQNDFRKMKFRPGVGKSNYNQFSGLNTSLETNAAGIPTFGGFGDEEIEDGEIERKPRIRSLKDWDKH
tara:strand:- start:8386 stop:8655 length:270 start_codon:yes stop_codon:yes gene_type:complete